MEEQIITELQSIKVILWIILGLVSISTYVLVIGVVGRNLGSKESIKSDNFVSEAKGLEVLGKNEQLADLAKKRIEQYPKDIVAWYYLAISQLRSENYQGALEAFSEVQSIDPHWEYESIQEYISSVRESMDGPK